MIITITADEECKITLIIETKHRKGPFEDIGPSDGQGGP